MRYGIIVLAFAFMALVQSAGADPQAGEEALYLGYQAGAEGRPADARAAFRQACEAGSSDGCRQLASGLRFDSDITPDETGAAAAGAKALAIDIAACEAGDAMACRYVGEGFRFGNIDVPANADRAKYYTALAIGNFSTRCASGDAVACREASYFYTEGSDLADPDLAASFERKAVAAEFKACEAGDAYICLQLADQALGSDQTIPGFPGFGEAGARAVLARARPAIEGACATNAEATCLKFLEWRYFGYGAPADPEGALAQAEAQCRAGSAGACLLRFYLVLSDPVRIKPGDYEKALTFLDAGCAVQTARGGVSAPGEGQGFEGEDVCAMKESMASPDVAPYIQSITRGIAGLEADCAARKADACGTLGSTYASGAAFRFNADRYERANPYFRKQAQYACEIDGGDRCVDYAESISRGDFGPADKATGNAMLTSLCDGGAAGAARACMTLGNEALFGSTSDDAAAQAPMADPSAAAAIALPYFEKACRLGDQYGCESAESLKYPDAYAPAADAAPVYSKAPEDIAALQSSCDQHNKDSCYELANIYAYGDGVPPDYGKAKGLYKSACYMKHAEACGQWASEELNLGTEAGKLSAASAYREGCALGIGWTCLEAGYLILDGAFGGVPAPQQAFWEFENGCKLGHQDSCLQAGLSLDRGDPGYTDPNLALTYFERVCQQGYTRGCGLAGLMFSAGRAAPGGEVTVIDVSSGQFSTQKINGLSPSPDGARRFYEMGCPMPLPDGVFDDPLSCTNLGVLHSSGALGAADPVTALRYFERACSIGEPAGCFNAGVFYEDGRGAASNPVRAIEYYRNACDIGYADGCSALTGLE